MIDVHTHILPPGWPDLGERCPRFERIDAHYPFAMGEAEPGATIRKTATSDEERRALTRENARRFLGLA